MAQEQLPFLNRIARRRPAAERCELCSVELAPMHQHLLDPVTRQMTLYGVIQEMATFIIYIKQRDRASAEK